MSPTSELSFARKLRAKRVGSLHGLTMITAVAASLGMGATVAPPAPATAAAQQEAPREFIDEQTRKRRAPAPVQNRVKGGGLRRRLDSRKARRRFIMLLLRAENTGRQWVRTHRGLRKTAEGAWLLSQPAWRLQAIAQRMGVAR